MNARRKGGCYFGKRSRGMLQPERPYMLAVEDPKDPSNDLGKGSYNIQKVWQAPLQGLINVYSLWSVING